MSVLDGLDLASPGGVLAARARVEHATSDVAGREFRAFLGTVAEAAAAGALSWAVVEEAWAAVAGAVVAAGAGRAGLPGDGQVAGWLRELAAGSGVPAAVFDTVSVVLAAGAVAGWGQARLRDELATVLAPDGGPVQPGMDGLPVRVGAAWDTGTSGLARTVATAAVGAGVVALLAGRGGGGMAWVTRRDDRVRATHAAADGQRVPVGGRFVVGGWAMAYPGDPAGPVWETAGCRCVVVSTRAP